MVQTDWPVAHAFLAELWAALDGDPRWLERVRFEGAGELQSPFALTDFAAATFAAAGAALGELVATSGAPAPDVRVDRRLASGWHVLPPAPGIPLAGRQHFAHSPWFRAYPTADDRYLRLQGVYPSQRARILRTLDVQDDPEDVARVVAQHPAQELEDRLVEAGVAAAANRTIDEWLDHPAGRAIAAEPIIGLTTTPGPGTAWQPTPGRPLAGIKVLDMTRVIAGPMATRFLAAAGAEVLRIDAPDGEEAAFLGARAADLVLGKRLAYLDLKSAEGVEQFKRLLAEADVFIHNYRPGAIDSLLAEDERRAIKPDLVEVGLRAYGWEGPWAARRGFDTIVQWSSGICDATQAWGLADPARRLPLDEVGRKVDASVPRHMVVESLDFGAGHQIAAAAIRGLTRRLTTDAGSFARLSLARTALTLIQQGQLDTDTDWLQLPLDGPLEDRVYTGLAGPVRRLAFPLEVAGNPLFWERGAEWFGSSRPVWST